MRTQKKTIALLLLGLLTCGGAFAVDTVTSNVVKNGKAQYVVHLTATSDGTGESAAIKVDKSTLRAIDGAEPASLDIEQIEWNMQGYTQIKILWDHGTQDDTALILNGTGYKDFRGLDGAVLGQVGAMRLLDPRTAAGTGDVILTTTGHASGSTYDMTLWVYKNPN